MVDGMQPSEEKLYKVVFFGTYNMAIIAAGNLPPFVEYLHSLLCNDINKKFFKKLKSF